MVLIGDGPERQHYINYVKKRKFKDIYFTGKLFGKELYQFYKSADIFVLASFKEMWPNVYFEAMAAKCAVILTKDSFVEELVENEKHGIFVNPNSFSEIEIALIRLIENNNLKKQLKENGYKLAQKLTWTKQGILFWETLQELLP